MKLSNSGWLQWQLAALALCVPLIPSAQAETPCRGPDRDISIIHRTPPTYPPIAGLLCVQGDVRLEFVVNTAGSTQDIQIVQSTASGIFDRAARDAVSRWVFEPRCLDGRLSDRSAVQTIEFNLTPEQSSDCPTVISDELMDTTVSIAAIYGTFADALLISGPDEFFELPEMSPQLDREWAQIEQLHIAAVEDHARVLNSEFRKQLIQTQHELIDYDRLHADRDFSETERLAARYLELLEQVARFDIGLRDALWKRAEGLQAQSEVNEDDWRFLVSRFIQPGSEALRQRIAAEALLESVMALMRTLHSQREGWTPNPDVPSQVLFSDQQLEQAVEPLAQQVSEQRAELISNQLEWLLSWSQL